MNEKSVVSLFFSSHQILGLAFLLVFLRVYVKAEVDQKTICCLLVIRVLLVFRPVPG